MNNIFSPLTGKVEVLLDTIPVILYWVWFEAIDVFSMHIKIAGYAADWQRGNWPDTPAVAEKKDFILRELENLKFTTDLEQMFFKLSAEGKMALLEALIEKIEALELPNEEV